MLRHLKLALIFLLTFFATMWPAHAQDGESISLFNSNIFVNKSGVVTVIEEITYDFASNSRHGIFRNIKTTFENSEGKKYKTPVNVIRVTNSRGENLNYTVTDNNDALSVKIGDPNIELTGVHTYIIDYEVRGAIESFSDHDEIFWNVTGDEWEVPIGQVTGTIHLPEEIPNASLNADCYTGAFGSTQKSCTLRTNITNELDFATNNPLGPREGISVALGFDKGFVTVLPKEEVKTFDLSDPLAIVLFLFGILWYLVLPPLLIVYYYKNGRDPKALYGSIPALFEAPKNPDTNDRLPPAKVGTIYDEIAEDKDITATIVDLAIRGYITIEEASKENLIEKITNKNNFLLKKSEKYKTKDKYKLQSYEQKIIDGLFGSNNSVYTKDLKNKFASDAKEVKTTLYEDVVSEGYFPHNPEKVRNFWLVGGFITLATVNIPCGILALVLAKVMPRKTQKGVKVKTDAEGLKKFLTSQEEQLEYQEMNWYMFEKLLPYAIAFGVTKKWAERFEHLHSIPQDSWYTGTQTLNAVAFANSIDSFNNSVGSIATPTSSSSGFSSGVGGGGFSGGGFSGGGGGGSW